MSKIQELNPSFSPTELVSKLFYFANTIKLAHLRVSGPGAYAAHVALGDLYDGLADSADDIAELFQGYKGIQNYSIPSSFYVEPVAFTKSIQKYLIKQISGLGSMPDIQNKVQDLLAIVTKSIYKLENLK